MEQKVAPTNYISGRAICDLRSMFDFYRAKVVFNASLTGRV